MTDVEADPTVALAAEGGDDAEDGELAALLAPRRRRLPWVTQALAGLLLAGGGFLGGVLIQKHHDKNIVTAASAVTNAARARTGAAAGGGFGGGGGGAGGAGGGAGGGGAAGQVKLVDGTTIYLTDFSGNTITVTTSGASKFTKQKDASLHDVQPGDTVVVRGAAQSDGSVAATQVTDAGPGGAAGGGFGGGRRFGGGAGAGGGTGGG
jgi:hypothetical protein